ncbi:MAG: hypothetical protein WED04_10130 [Promethearchaeati archaeon SRVP18_Atabeyarchaeia-1]
MQLGIYLPSRHREFTSLTPVKILSRWRSKQSVLSFGCPRPRRGFRAPFIEMRFPVAATAVFYLEKYEEKKKPGLEELVHEFEGGKPAVEEGFVGYAFRLMALPQRGAIIVSSLGGPLNTNVAEEAISAVLDMCLPSPNGFERFVPRSEDLKCLCDHYLQTLPGSEVYKVRATVEDVEVELKGSDLMKSEIYERIDHVTQIGSSPLEGAGYRWESDRVGRIVTMRISAPEGRGVIGVSAGRLTAEESVLLSDEVMEKLESALGNHLTELVLGKATAPSGFRGIDDYVGDLPPVVPVVDLEERYLRDSRMVAAEIQRLIRLGYQMRFDTSRGRLLVARE